MAKAFCLGKLESESVFNLRLRIDPGVLALLTSAVKTRGMAKLLNHEVIARDVFNRNYTSGINSLEQWREELRNRDDNVLVSCHFFVSKCLEFFFLASYLQLSKDQWLDDSLHLGWGPCSFVLDPIQARQGFALCEASAGRS